MYSLLKSVKPWKKAFGPKISRAHNLPVADKIVLLVQIALIADYFDVRAEDFIRINKDIEIPKGEGVSGLVKKSVWDEVGGNDSIFAPASWEDMDLFLRMLHHDVQFILPASSLVWHFGARGSHRLEENNGRSSERQIQSEQTNARKWLQKWGKLPIFDEYGMIKAFK